ncbi:MAG: chemotaxis protein CheA [Campylobacterales bacterium]|nr:chemotaxis protein CheA [Campylobacterales bacterium]
MNPLLEQFLLEARENLAFIDQNIEKIGGEDPELLNAVFRAAHTLKGGSGIVGFEGVKTITHHAEDLLDLLRSGKLPFREEMVESLYNAFDEVMNLVEAAEESGDIVDADEVRIEAIAEELRALMGKSGEEKAAWACPFSLIDHPQRFISVPMPFLSSLRKPLTFAIGDIDEAVCSASQLYAIVFDVDESCMLYGNDPLYALSLLGENVLGICSCMSHESAVSLLSGTEDPEGLGLKLQMVAFVDADYLQISDALFNFMDELLLYPLDIATLLGTEEGERAHELDILKELYHEILSPLRERARDEVSDRVAKSLQLIGKETLQSAQLRRLQELLGAIREEDLPKLEGFFARLFRGEPYRYDPDEPIGEPGGVAEIPAEETASAASSATVRELDETVLAQMDALLAQQLMALEVVEDAAVEERVNALLQNYIRPFIPQMPDAFDSRADMVGWLRTRLGIPEEEIECETEPEVPIPEKTPTAAAVAVQPETTLPTTVSEPAAAEEASPEVTGGAAKKSVIGKTVKIEQESIDNLMNIVGELLVAKNSLPYLAEGVHAMSAEGIRRSIMEKYTFINRLAEQLQDLIMSMRMLPISYVFDRYPKLVRDISKNLGKKVSLSMEGGDTKLDKNMIEMLADPMIHIMRNSLDHGIESPETRLQKGKNPEGEITLRAYAQSDKIIIEIKDDGAGINIGRVVQKVIEKNLLTLDQIDAMSDDEKASLVMLPGLSTADTISEYSGRGVGMDVVKKSIENFGGTIRIKTVANQGTTITLSIPVSLAVTSLLHVAMNSVHYGFPMDSVSETVKISAEEIEYLHNEPFIYLRGEVIPLLFIKTMLDEKGLEGKSLPVVVLSVKGNRIAVVVNELLGQLDVVQKPLEGIMEHHPIFSGTALLGNGQIIMAIDPLGMLGISHLLKSESKQAS